MKYNLTINLKALYDITHKLDINDASILDYLIQLCSSSSEKIDKKRVDRRGKKYTWINYNHLLEELPLITVRSKQSVGRIITKLKKEGFIVDFIDRTSKRKYVRLKPLVDSLFLASAKEKVDSRFTHGTKSFHPRNKGRSTSGTNHITRVHNNTNDHINKLQKKIKTKLQEIIDYYFRLKGWKYETDDPTEKEKMKIRYKRNLRDAKELLVMCDQDVSKATAKIFKLKGWATHNNCSWNLGTVVKRFDEDNFKADKKEFVNTQTGEVFKTAEELSASYKKLDQAKRSTNGFEKL